ncbi:MAG: biotin/lipoyl-binding protein, partial [Actinomycetota bacterium]
MTKPPTPTAPPDPTPTVQPSTTPKPRSRSRGKARRVQRWLIALVLLLAVGAFAWHRARNPPLPEVTAGVVTQGPLIAEWAATGYVEARTADVSSPSTGRVLSVEAREGDPVRRGQVLARLSAVTETAAIETRRQG